MEDNKIYYDEWGGGPPFGVSPALHVINSPDSAGLNCNFKKNSFTIMGNSMDGFPNMPSYRPGVLVGSGCDTALSTGVEDIPISETIHLYPNPAHTYITLEAAGQHIDYASIYTLTGQLVSETDHPHIIDIQALPTGMYIVEVRIGDSLSRVKLVKDE